MSAKWLLPLMLALSSIHKAQQGCGPLEEDASTTLTCGSSCASNETLTWYADIHTTTVTVATCQGDVCEVTPAYSNNFSISPNSSTLTINSVSRSDPFNMETRWTCQCDEGPNTNVYTVCQELQIYALPENPECTVSENLGAGLSWSLTVSCSTTTVYPQARCSFYSEENGGARVSINQSPDYIRPITRVSPVYYSSRCSVSVSASELGEGTHSFQGYIYPDVTGGENLVNVIEPSNTITLSLPVAATSISCFTDMVDGYFWSIFAHCECSLTSEGYPRGRAQWYRDDGGQTVGGAGPFLYVAYDKDNPEQIFTCEGVSHIGRSLGYTLTAKFAFLEPNSVEIGLPPSGVNLCDNNSHVQVTCRISREKVSPVPVFSLSSERLTFNIQGSVTVNGNHYQQQFSSGSAAIAGEYQVTCRVTNTVLNTVKEALATVKYNEPPPLPPQVTLTVKGQTQTYQGVDPSNTVTLAEGYTGDVTCRVEGGYPDAHNTQLKCGNLEGSVGGKTSTLSFAADTLTRDMDGTVCACTSQHDSGCYSNRETTLTLNVVYPPEVTFTRYPPKSQPLKEGDDLELTCSVQGNPEPTPVTLTRERTSEVLENVQTTELTHTIDPLSCLDTGLYICSGQNSQVTTAESISVEVLCPQRFLPGFDSSPDVGAVIGETAQIELEIYGFPEPRALTMLKLIDSTNLTSSPRHSVKYTASEAPFGFVNVTISDVIDTDYTNYTLTVDNGEGEALTYSFYLYDVNATLKPFEESVGGSGDVDGVAIGVGVGVAVLVILVVVVVVVVVMLRKRGSSLQPPNKRHRPNQYVMFEINQSSYANVTPTSINLAPSTNHYEQVDDDFGLPATSTNHYDEINDLRVAPSPQHVEYLTPSSGLYNPPLPQDTKPPGIYSRPRPVASPSEDHQTSGPYNNTPEQLGENPDVGVISEPNETTLAAGSGSNYAYVTMAMENPYVDAMSEQKETTITAGPGANYTNVTITTENPFDGAAMSEMKESTVTIQGSGASYTNVTMATVTEHIQNNNGSGNAYENVDLS